MLCQAGRGELASIPVCTLNISLPDKIIRESTPSDSELFLFDKSYSYLRDNGLGKCFYFLIMFSVFFLNLSNFLLVRILFSFYITEFLNLITYLVSR